MASLAAFGREQAIRASNLTRSIEAQKLDQTNVRRQLENANNQAYQSVAVAPVPGRRPAPPVLQATQSTNYTPFIGPRWLVDFWLKVVSLVQEGLQNGVYRGSLLKI